MKYPNGTFKEWASNVTEREHYENQILYTYYCKINEAFIICFKILIFSIFFPIFQQSQQYWYSIKTD